MGGYLAGSLAIMTDAAHLLSDCISFIVALLAIVWAKKSPNNYMTFGYKRIGKCLNTVDITSSAVLVPGETRVFNNNNNNNNMHDLFVCLFFFPVAEVLGAIISIFGIWLLTTFLFYFAVNRLMYQDFNIDADTMMIVSAVGIVINIM